MAGKFIPWIKQTSFVQWQVQILKGIRPPGFEGMNLFELLQFLVKSFREGNFSVRGAAISFNLILAIFPLLKHPSLLKFFV